MVEFKRLFNRDAEERFHSFNVDKMSSQVVHVQDRVALLPVIPSHIKKNHFLAIHLSKGLTLRNAACSCSCFQPYVNEGFSFFRLSMMVFEKKNHEASLLFLNNHFSKWLATANRN